MAVVVAFIYILATIVYLTLGDSTRAWGGFNMLSLLLPLAAVMYVPKPTSPFGKDLFNFAIGLTLVRSLYTILCIYAELSWVYEKTNYFTATVIVCFLAFLVYSAITHKKL